MVGVGDSGHCAARTAILNATVLQLVALVTAWLAAEGGQKMITGPAEKGPTGGGKRKSKRKTRKSKKTRKGKKGKKGKKGRKSSRKH